MRVRRSRAQWRAHSFPVGCLILALFGTSLATEPAQAGPMDTRAAPTKCQMNVNNSTAYKASLFDLKFNADTSLTVSESAQVGAVLARYFLSLPTIQDRTVVPLGHCPPGTIEIFEMSRGTPVSVPGLTDVYSTSVAGVGYQVSYPGENLNFGPKTYINTYLDGFLYWPPGTLSIMQLVKTGPITGGTIAAGVYGNVRVTGTGITSNMAIPQLLRVGLAQAIRISMPTCSFLSEDRAKTFQLQPVNKDRFTGIGSQMYPKEFSVSARCAGGSARPNVRFTATSGVVSGTSGVLALTADSTAKGVGVFLKRRDPNGQYVPVTFDGGLVAMGVGQGLISGSYVWRLEMQAGYQQTSNPVEEGSVKSLVTLAVTYN